MPGPVKNPLTVVFRNESGSRLTAAQLEDALSLPGIARIANGEKATVTQEGDSFTITYADLQAGDPISVTLGQNGQLSLTYAGGDQSTIQAGTSPIVKEAARVIASIAALNVPGAQA